MTETSKSEVNELLDAFAKVSILYVQQQLNLFKDQQARHNQATTLKLAELERELNKTKESLEASRKAYKDLAKKVRAEVSNGSAQG